MAHHLTPDVERGWILDLTNVLLIRDPREVIASYLRSRDQVTVDDIGLRQQNLLYDDLAGAGIEPRVIDAADFLGDPEHYLRGLCELVRVEFDEAMLSLAFRAAGERRCLGAVLVCRGPRVDRVLAVPSTGGRPRGPGSRRRRPVPALVRAPVRETMARLTALGAATASVGSGVPASVGTDVGVGAATASVGSGVPASVGTDVGVGAATASGSLDPVSPRRLGRTLRDRDGRCGGNRGYGVPTVIR